MDSIFVEFYVMSGALKTNQRNYNKFQTLAIRALDDNKLWREEAIKYYSKLNSLFQAFCYCW